MKEVLYTGIDIDRFKHAQIFQKYIEKRFIISLKILFYWFLFFQNSNQLFAIYPGVISSLKQEHGFTHIY